jgi:hypothetical protein
MRKSGDRYVPVELRDGEGLLPLHWPRATVEALRARFRGSGELRNIRD